MKSLFKNFNFFKLFFAISLVLLSSVSLSEDSNGVKESIVSVDDLIETYNSSDSTNKTAIDKVSIQDFISEEPYYILIDSLLVGALTDALNFIGLDMDTPSSSKGRDITDETNKTGSGSKAFSDASMVLIYIIKAAWGVGMLIFAFVFAKFVFRAVFEGASSGGFGSKDSPLAMWDIARISFAGLLIPTDISANSAIQVPLIVHFIIIAIAISLVLVAIFMITVANFTFVDSTIIPAPIPFSNIVAPGTTGKEDALEKYKIDFHESIFTKYDANVSDISSIKPFITDKSNLQTRYPLTNAFLDSPTDLAYLDSEVLYLRHKKDFIEMSSMRPHQISKHPRFENRQEFLNKNRVIFKNYLDGLRLCMSNILPETKSPFNIVDTPTLISGDVQLYKNSSLKANNFNPEKIDIFKITVTNDKPKMPNFTSYNEKLKNCLDDSHKVNGFMDVANNEIKKITNTAGFWGGLYKLFSADRIHYSFIEKIRTGIKASVKNHVSINYQDLLDDYNSPHASYTLYGTPGQLQSKYGIPSALFTKHAILSPPIPLAKFNAPTASIEYKPPLDHKFYSESKITSIDSQNTNTKFTNIVSKMNQMDKKAYDDALVYKQGISTDDYISICSSNPAIREFSAGLSDKEVNKGSPTLCSILDEIYADAIAKSPEATNGVCYDGSSDGIFGNYGASNEQKACQARMAPLTAMSPNSTGSPSNMIMQANNTLVLVRAFTRMRQIGSGFNMEHGVHTFNNHFTSMNPLVEKLQNMARVPLFVIISYKATIFAMFLFALFILLANTVKNIVIAPMWAASLTKQSQQEGVAGDQLHGFKEILYIILYPSILLISIMITFYSLSFIISVLYEMVIINKFFITHQLEYFLSFMPGSSSTWIQPIISWISSMAAYFVFYVLMFLITIRTFKWMFIMPYKIMKSVGISTNQMNKNMMKEMMSVAK